MAPAPAGQAATKPSFANIAAKAVSSAPPVQILAKNTDSPTDDTSTHVSSESSVKQSVASGTTFAMDEKESLRPDDSASIRAIEEEDCPSTGATGSRVGSDTDARAFSDQLHRIQQIGMPRPVLQQRPNITFGQMPLNPVPEPAEEPSTTVTVAPGVPPIDEKLLEGLNSPRDRVFILKIEQDILDFLKNEQDQHLTLPDCNSFYRMLAHRLADYYGLDHTHHPRDSGTAVMISKTPHSRVPPPLASIPTSGAQSDPSPPPTAARKIMRRGGDGRGASGPSTTANSEGPSKAASEAGDGGSELGKPKDNSNLTREEREARYAEARLRIFGTAEAEEEDAKKAAEEIDASRSSSASGKKKTKKRKDDDDFEPRSLFGPQMSSTAYTDGYYFNPQFGAMQIPPQQYPMSQATTSPPIYGSGYPQGDMSSQMAYGPQPYSNHSANGVNGQTYNGQYDISVHMGMMNISGPPAMKPNGSPGYASNNQMQPPQGWAANYDANSYMYGQASVQPNYSDRTMPSSSQNGTTVPYAFGQLPNPGFSNGKAQHPLPGSFNRQQFNPATQAFIPGSIRPGSMPVMSSQNNTPFFGPYHASQSPMQPFRTSAAPNAGLPHRSTPPKGNMSAFGPPNGNTHLQAYNGNAGGSPALPSVNLHSQPHSAPPTAATSAPNMQRPVPSQTHSSDARPLAHPLPQMPHPQSSIAKWGTPSHLPPKPPTPTDPVPRKFVDINKNHHVSRNIMANMSNYAGQGN